MKRTMNKIPEVNIPKNGWFHNSAMKVLLGKELADVFKYPLKNNMFGGKKDGNS